MAAELPHLSEDVVRDSRDRRERVVQGRWEETERRGDRAYHQHRLFGFEYVVII